MKIKRVNNGDGSLYGFRMDCPGCKCPHVIPVKPHAIGWDWNGSEDRPTFSPSILVHEVRIPIDADPSSVLHPYKPGDIYQPRCHSFVRDGRWEFLGDCGHALSGQTVDLSDIEA